MSLPKYTLFWVAVTLVMAGITPMDTQWFGPRRPPPPPLSASSPPLSTLISSPPPPSAVSAKPPVAGGFKQRSSDMIDFIKYCAKYMHRFSPRFHRPGDVCCEKANKVSIPLFCKIFLMPETEMVFNPVKVAIVASECGKPLRRFSWCGSYFIRKGPKKAINSSLLEDQFHAPNYTILE